MTARKTLSAQAARAQEAQAAQGENRPQEAQERPQEATAAPAQGNPAAQAAPAAQARARIPGAPRNYTLETRTLTQAQADDPDSYPWPYPVPVHGVSGFYKTTAFKAQELTGGEYTPEEIIGEGDDALLILISNAKLLAHGEIIQNALVVQHETFGSFYLRCVKSAKGGFLIGIIDDFDSTYGAAEWYETAEDAAEAWADWAALTNPQH